jgi:thymidylate synthase (FAD)
VKIVKQSVTLEFITPSASELIERAARTCYKSEGLIADGSAAKLIKKMWDRGHHTPIEHAYASFRVVGDRGVSHEFVRHRLMTFCQESTRYCNYTKEQFGTEVTVIEPPGLDGEVRDMWVRIMEHSESVYCNLIARKVPPEIARSVLPNSLKTEFVVSANFREWLHFLYLRNAPAAHPQMREIAGMIEEILVRECPAVFVLMAAKRRKENAVAKLVKLAGHIAERFDKDDTDVDDETLEDLIDARNEYMEA